MKWKIANTLFVVSIFLFIVGAVFNYYQSKNSIESSLEKARRIKKEKAEPKVDTPKPKPAASHRQAPVMSEVERQRLLLKQMRGI